MKKFLVLMCMLLLMPVYADERGDIHDDRHQTLYDDDWGQLTKPASTIEKLLSNILILKTPDGRR